MDAGAGVVMGADDRIERIRTVYEQVVFGGDAGGLDDAERGLDAVEADAAVGRGRLLHARFLNERTAGLVPVEDPAALPLFERAATLYQDLGDVRGEGEALFWIGCLYQVVRRDNGAAVPILERSRRLAAQAGDEATEADALRHLGIAAHAAGRLDEARERLEESSRLWRRAGTLPGVAANMIGLAYIDAARDRRADAMATLDEAYAIATAHGARAVARQIEQVRTEI
ncbi:tetratricopeptide repeat protein [Actinoplanes xinjiangensis]|nr:tetratricopeptide repeat protein [Actinoplanes xinjiangensis]